MTFDDPTLYGRDEEEEFGDSGAYSESLEEDFEEEEEEEEEAGLPEPAVSEPVVSAPPPPAPRPAAPAGGGGGGKPCPLRNRAANPDDADADAHLEGRGRRTARVTGRAHRGAAIVQPSAGGRGHDSRRRRVHGHGAHVGQRPRQLPRQRGRRPLGK